MNNNIGFWHIFSIAIFMISQPIYSQENGLIFNSGKYKVYSDRVVQGNYKAHTLTGKEIISDYQSPANAFKSPHITFKFSINGQDNEMISGIDHQFTCYSEKNACETPLIIFGKQLQGNIKIPSGTYLTPNTDWTIRLDMRHVFKEFEQKGYYTTFKGERIYKEDFKGIYVAGNTAPLTWDFDNLVHHKGLQLKDEDGDRIYEIKLVLNPHGELRQNSPEWRQTRDLSAYPQYESSHPISNALYLMSLEEMVNAVEPDSTFRTGKEWAGVWTRDISYSIILSMAHLQPIVARYSLMKKVNGKKRIIQDTGTGGAWPVSTDRIVWAIAAWELYLATGDDDWLREAYTIIKNTVDDDQKTVYDSQTGLVKGESSFLDWREQTYPLWMEPSDIFESFNLGTNAVHYQANIILGKMAAILGHNSESSKYKAYALRIKEGINKYLWQPELGYYGQYLYGRNHKIISPRSEALGLSLCILFGIADSDRAKEIISKTPFQEFGMPCIYPQIPNIPPYHNNGIWPFVQAYWLWASAKAGNEEAVLKSIASIYRPAALFATNKENFVSENGDYMGTQINSDNMLWSLAGNLSIIHKVLFGIQFNESSISFKPFVPEGLQGKRVLNNFRYRNAVLNIQMEGYGRKVKFFELDGKKLKKHEIPSTLTGTHNLRIVLNGKPIKSQPVNNVTLHTSPVTPNVVRNGNKLSWSLHDGVSQYVVLKNGKRVLETPSANFTLSDKEFGEYQVVAVDKNGFQSFASEPLTIIPGSDLITIEAEKHGGKADYNYKGFNGEGFSEINNSINRNFSFHVTISEKGVYSIDFRYANGNGPINTDNKCAIRTLYVDGSEVGVIVFPHRGKEEWSNWGFSNSLQVQLSPGSHVVSLEFKDWNDNMNEVINQAMIDQVRIIKIGSQR